MKKSNTMTLDEFKDKHYGKRGTPKREKFEAGYEDFKISALLREVGLEKGLTQDEPGCSLHDQSSASQ
jgi:hypothetical protein